MSFRLCKILFNQNIFGAFSVLNRKSCNLNSFKSMSLIAHEKEAQVAHELDQFFNNKERNCCRDFLMKETSVPVQWESLEKNLKLFKSANFRSTILSSCNVLKKGDLALDYYLYLLNKGEKLSIIETSLLIKILANHKVNLKNYEKLLEPLYNHSHDILLAMEVSVKEAINVFCNNKSCFEKICKNYDQGKLNPFGIEILIARAFDLDEPELAWKIASENPSKISHVATTSYLKFCIRSVLQKKFSVGMIDDMINFSKTHTVIFKCSNFPDHIDELVRTLNKSETEYLWSFDECFVKKYVCSICQYKFKRETITAEELEKLKNNFIKEVIISSNINMKTSTVELSYFFDFLKNCKPYDMVIDGLNLVYGTFRKKIHAEQKLSFFESLGMRILLVGRSHFQHDELYNKFKRKYQVFLARNDSIDDLFCLYAAMHQGLNTYFCTADFCRDHAKFFAQDFTLANIFRKWQISHQYVLPAVEKGKMLHPRFHSDIPQSSVVLGHDNNVKEYRWHLSYLDDSETYRLEKPAKWICLRAKSKASR